VSQQLFHAPAIGAALHSDEKLTASSLRGYNKSRIPNTLHLCKWITNILERTQSLVSNQMVCIGIVNIYNNWRLIFLRTRKIVKMLTKIKKMLNTYLIPVDPKKVTIF
jgi:hypothetical protein